MASSIKQYLHCLFEWVTTANILEPEILGNHNINTGKILLLKAIVN